MKREGFTTTNELFRFLDSIRLPHLAVQLAPLYEGGKYTDACRKMVITLMSEANVDSVNIQKVLETVLQATVKNVDPQRMHFPSRWVCDLMNLEGGFHCDVEAVHQIAESQRSSLGIDGATALGGQQRHTGGSVKHQPV